MNKSDSNIGGIIYIIGMIIISVFSIVEIVLLVLSLSDSDWWVVFFNVIPYIFSGVISCGFGQLITDVYKLRQEIVRDKENYMNSSDKLSREETREQIRGYFK